jgi:hypothetical protein
MNNRNRSALTICAALVAAFGLGTPSSAEGLSAQGGRISARQRRKIFAEAIPFAQTMKPKKGPPTKDLAGALNNLAQALWRGRSRCRGRADVKGSTCHHGAGGRASVLSISLP